MNGGAKSVVRRCRQPLSGKFRVVLNVRRLNVHGAQDVLGKRIAFFCKLSCKLNGLVRFAIDKGRARSLVAVDDFRRIVVWMLIVVEK